MYRSSTYLHVYQEVLLWHHEDFLIVDSCYRLKLSLMLSRDTENQKSHLLPTSAWLCHSPVFLCTRLFFQECSSLAIGLFITGPSSKPIISATKNNKFFDPFALMSLSILDCRMICTQFWAPFWKTHLKSHFQVSKNSVLAFRHSKTTLKFCKVVFILTGASDKLKLSYHPFARVISGEPAFGGSGILHGEKSVTTPWHHQHRLNVRMGLGWSLSKWIV